MPAYVCKGKPHLLLIYLCYILLAFELKKLTTLVESSPKAHKMKSECRPKLIQVNPLSELYHFHSIDFIKQKQLNFWGHLQTMDDQRQVKHIYEANMGKD